jgi:hypothetical protein
MDSALEYILSGVHGPLWPCLIVSGAQAAASRSPGASDAYSFLIAPRACFTRGSVLIPVEEEGGTVRHVVKSCLPAPIVGWKKCKRELLSVLVLFRLVDPSLQP